MMLAISRNKDPKASAPYLSLLKLSHPPFSDHAGEAFFYADPQRTQYLDMLQHLAQYSDEVLLVSGESGSGKTELLERFLERAEDHWRTCRLEGGQRLEADALFSRIAECFQLKLSGSDNLLESMQGQLSALQEQQLPVLLIDDAEALSDDALEIVMHLAVLEGEHGNLIRVLMFADPSLEQRLAGERFSAMPQPHKQPLQGLDEAQATAYLNHRLLAAGYQGDALFSSRDIKQLLRDSGGLPGGLNEAAHELLQQKLSRAKPKTDMRRYLQMGLAASAVIGTVVGLNDRINALFGGEPKVMTVSSPERPVIRLAEEGNPWAVVIRNGESIQINCGAPGTNTVGVRPLMTASAEMAGDMPLSKPIMRDVSPSMDKDAPPAAENRSEVKVPPKQQAVVKQKPEAAAEETAPVPAESKPAAAATVVAANEPEELPLVVKQQEESADKETKAPAELKIGSVQPSPVPAGDKPTEVNLVGSAFVDGSKVAVSHAGKVQVLPQGQVAFVDSEHLKLTIIPGKAASDWAVQVSTPDNKRSNVLRFRVEPVAKAEPPAETTEEKAAAPSEPPKSVSEAPKAVKTTPKQLPAKAEPKPEPKAKPARSGKIEGYDWYASQPKSGFTLQLLASEKRTNAEVYAQQHKLPSPVGEFAMEHDGKTLYALTQGSYPSRAEAEKAVAAMPGGVKPWIRSFASVQQVMKRQAPVAAKQKASTSPAGGDGRYKDTAWVWSQDPGHYTVQLSAASSEQAIEADMRRISLPGELTVVQTLRDGKPWYALVYGSFASKEAARGTIDRLPPALKQAGPWARSFASLQDEISRSTPVQ